MPRALGTFCVDRRDSRYWFGVALFSLCVCVCVCVTVFANPRINVLNPRMLRDFNTLIICLFTPSLVSVYAASLGGFLSHSSSFRMMMMMMTTTTASVQ